MSVKYQNYIGQIGVAFISIYLFFLQFLYKHSFNFMGINIHNCNHGVIQ